MKEVNVDLNTLEVDAIAAALRALGNNVATGKVTPNDGDIGDILTSNGSHEGLNAVQIHALCDRLLRAS